MELLIRGKHIFGKSKTKKDMILRKIKKQQKEEEQTT